MDSIAGPTKLLDFFRLFRSNVIAAARTRTACFTIVNAGAIAPFTFSLTSTGRSAAQAEIEKTIQRDIDLLTDIRDDEEKQKLHDRIHFLTMQQYLASVD